MRISLALAMCFVPVLAQAQMVDPADPGSVVDALQDLGYRAQLDPASDGDPRIRSAIEGSNYSIWFYGCSNNTDCDALNFSTGFDMEDGLSWSVANEWNRRQLVGRVYLDEERDPFIDYFVEAEGGLPRETFEEVLRGWGSALARFKEEIDW